VKRRDSSFIAAFHILMSEAHRHARTNQQRPQRTT
jgi:hypothetical protein